MCMYVYVYFGDLTTKIHINTPVPPPNSKMTVFSTKNA